MIKRSGIHWVIVASILFVFCLTLPSLATKKITIGLATKSAINLFWPVLQEGAQDAANDLNVNLIVQGPQKTNDIKDQLAVIDGMLGQNIDALVVAPCDSVGIVPAIKKAQIRRIPVIAVDTAVIGAKVTSFIATDNISAVESAATWIAIHLKGSGRVILINGMLSQQTGRDRRDGFVNYLKKYYPRIQVIKEIPADYDPYKAKVAIEAILKTNIHIDAIFCSWDDATIAVSKSLESIKRKKDFLLVGFDGAPNALRLLKQGKVDADVAQLAYKMGYQAVKNAIYAAKGKQIPPLIHTDSMVVTSDNLNDFLKMAHLTIED
jgi:ribose transport system substrate-binding protein